MSLKRRLYLFLLPAMLAVVFITVAGADFLIDDDFNREATGAKPAGYLLEETGGGIEIAEVPSATDKSIFLNDPGDKVIKITKKFAPQAGLVTVELSFMQPVFGSTAKVVRLLDQEGASAAVHIETRKDTTCFLAYKNADGSFTTLGAYAEKTWYAIKIVADVASQKADVYVDGAQKLTQVPFLAPVKTVGAIDSYTPGSSNKGHYVDNVKVYAGK
ncbi:MAG: hypothetical protein ACM3ZC_11825 [Bacteroidota bacterium]